MLLGAVALGCSSTDMRVTFPGFPHSVQGLAADDCKLTSRSPRIHLLRVGLSVVQGGRTVDADSKVAVTISNVERALVIGKANLAADGQVVEVTLKGPANTGEHLLVRGNYAVAGERYEFRQQCHVD